ncbi:MAG: DUF481 domain-containing protein [Deltaproteobacteria bacterium]|nr:DUF481 domain-containing protein [Deltaproteobacteria bacterium]
MTLHRWLRVVAAVALGAEAFPARAEEPKSPWKAQAAASYARTSGNTSTQTVAATAEAAYEPNPNRYYGKAGWMYGKNEGLTNTNKYYLDGRYERTITDRLFGFVNANFQKDKFSGYDYQWYVGPGLGYEFIKTDNHHLKGLAGVLYSYDKFPLGDSKDHDSYAAGLASAEYEWKITDTIKFKEAADYRVSLKDTNVYFINSNTTLEVKLAANLALGLGYLVNYRNDLPSKDLKHTDTTFLSSLIVTF